MRDCCVRCPGGGIAPTAEKEKLFSVGVNMTLILGAAEELRSSKVTPQESDQALPAVPSCWVVRLDKLQWQGALFAIFNTEHLWLKIVSSELDFCGLVPDGERLAVVRERSSGNGAAKMLYWEVACIDPCQLWEEMVIEVEQRMSSNTVGVGSARKISEDLTRAQGEVGSSRNLLEDLTEAKGKLRPTRRSLPTPVACQHIAEDTHR